MSSHAEAASASKSAGAQSAEHTAVTEITVPNLINNELNVTVKPQDIFVAHRLSTKRKPAPVIVRFTSLKVRNTVYLCL